MSFPSDDEIRRMEAKALKRARKIQRRIKKGKGVGGRQARGARRTVARSRGQGGGCAVTALAIGTAAVSLYGACRGWM